MSESDSPSVFSGDLLITDHAQAALVQVIREHTGIVLQDYQMEGLRKAVLELCTRFEYKSVDAFIDHFRMLKADAPEREFLMERVTIGESYFFRDEGQISFIRDSWLPKIIAQKRKTGSLSLRIWCAGCSDGQEPYTIAMLLENEIADLADWDVAILATDINANALHTAISGRYSEWSFRGTPESVRSRYFASDGNDYLLNEATRNRVTFSYLNLVDDSFPSLLNHTANQDIILCRNVFIYFDRPTVNAIMEKLTTCLLLDGHLIVGSSDPVSLDNKGLVYTHENNTGYFRRSDEQDTRPQKKQRSPLSGPAGRGAAASPRPAPALRKQPPPTPQTTTTPSHKELYKLIGQGDWAAAIRVIDMIESIEGENPDLSRSKAKVLANMGQLDAALGICEALIDGGSTDKHNHFMYGLIQLDRDDIVQAESGFRHAIFLDRNFLEAHYQLGMSLIRKGRRKLGVKSLLNALALAEAAPLDRVLHEAAGMTMERMIHVLRQSTDLYGSG